MAGKGGTRKEGREGKEVYGKKTVPLFDCQSSGSAPELKTEHLQTAPRSQNVPASPDGVRYCPRPKRYVFRCRSPLVQLLTL